MRKSLFLFFLLQFAVLSCVFGLITQDSTHSSATVEEIRISLDYVVKEDLKDVISKIKYIPLETNEDSEFSVISQLEITPDRYIILDATLNTILFFNKKGQFVKKIHSENDDISIPFKRIYKFSIDIDNDLLFFNDSGSKYLYFFDLEGNFKEVREKDIFSVYEYYFFGGNRIEYYNFDKPREINLETNDMLPNVLFFSEPENELVCADMLYRKDSFDDIMDIVGAQKNFHHSNGVLRMLTPYQNIVYKVEKEGKITEEIRFVFPMNRSLPSDFLTNPLYKNKRFKYIENHPEIIIQLSNFYSFDNWITFKAYTMLNITQYVYNTESFELYEIDLLKKNYVLGIDQNLLISYAETEFIKEIYKNSSKDERKIFPEEIKELFKSKRNNPALVLYELKDGQENIH